jgi:hypothetical protein
LRRWNVELAITLAMLGLAAAAAGALWFVSRVPEEVYCWRCGKELAFEDEWHVDVTRLPGKVFCGRCWERLQGGAE